MKQYHTQIVIQAPMQRVWAELTNFEAYPSWNPLIGELHARLAAGEGIRMFITPLNAFFKAEFVTVKENEEMTWIGVRYAGFLLTGRHYYRLEKVSEEKTRLLHGEYFTGWFAYFIPKSTLKMMETMFVVHNEMLKKRIEEKNEK
jgi:hypothetical protein